jgi:hypothetical protein
MGFMMNGKSGALGEISEDDPLAHGLAGIDDFQLRRAVERLREGLFDPLAVRLLTAHEKLLNEAVERGFREIDASKAPHLCIVGAYGQGKSHSLTYIQDRALRENFAVSMINLDPREIPFHDLKQVFRALMAGLRLPGGVENDSFISRFKAWAEAHETQEKESSGSLVDVLPNEMPHFFKCVLTAMAQKSISLPERQKKSKKHAGFRPREFPYLLARALNGEPVPLSRMRDVFKYRQVAFYKEGSLACRGTEPFLRMIRGLASLFRRMGHRGWVLLFDEAESIAQAQVFARGRSYSLLDRMFSPETHVEGLFPVFAFTEDFFEKVRQEDYDRVRIRGEMEIPYFERNYADGWRDLNVYRLHDLSKQEWRELSDKLIDLHARAYRWSPPEPRMREEMAGRLDELHNQETRLKLKALVDQLDLVQQENLTGAKL